MKILAVFKNGAIPVVWVIDDRGKHRIEYGEQVDNFSDSLQACRKFGEAVRLSLECAGAFNESPDQKDVCWFCEGRGTYIDGETTEPCPCC